jgi:beta-glucosidase
LFGYFIALIIPEYFALHHKRSFFIVVLIRLKNSYNNAMENSLSETQPKLKMPPGFLLGAATSAHQVEGNNMNSDWWHYEKSGKLPVSGTACDHYNRYEEDFQIAKDIGLNAFRISIEWSRIEPAENQWDKTAIEHYRKVLKKMKELGLVRNVTLHHFTLPLWLAEQGGFETKKGIEAFARFAWFVAQNLGDEIDMWGTINEPEVFVGHGYLLGAWPPFRKNIFQAIKVYRNLGRAHIAAYRAIKEVLPQAFVGIVKNNMYYEPYKNNLLNKLACRVITFWRNKWLLNMVKEDLDFIGINYYYTIILNLNWLGVKTMNSQDRPKSDMGWQTFPEGIYHVLSQLKKYNKPVYITENGIANARDDMRKDYIRQHLNWALKAKAEGLDLRGYFYWSLLDNYEWADGYGPRFGLVEMNYETQERKIRPSADIFKEMTHE